MPSPFQLQRVIYPAGALGSGSAAVSYSAEVTQFLQRLAPQPTGSLLTDYVNLIDGLVTDGVWSKLDVLQIYATGYPGQAVVNLIGNTSLGNPEVLSSQLTFTPNRGLQVASPSITRFCTNFEPAAGTNFQRNNGFAGVWSLTSTQISISLLTLGPINSATEADQLALYPKWISGIASGYIASASGAASAALASNSDGFFEIHRTAASGAGSIQFYKNGAQIATANVASAAYTAGHMAKLRAGHQTALYVAGASLNSTERTALRTRLAAYLTGRGAI